MVVVGRGLQLGYRAYKNYTQLQTALAMAEAVSDANDTDDGGQCDDDSDDDYWDDRFPVVPDLKKDRRRRNKERSDKPSDPEERDRRQRENEDRKRRTGRGGADPAPTGDDW